MRPTIARGGPARALFPILVLVITAALWTAPAAALAGQAQDTFRRGDSNRDAVIDIADAITILAFLFGGAGATLPCEDAADGNDDGVINVADPITVLSHLFTAPVPLPPPFAAPGSDPTPDLLGCATIDCFAPAEVDSLIGFIIGTYPLPDAIPASTQAIGGGVTVTIQQSDAYLTVSSIDYDVASASITAQGTAGADDVPFIAEWLIFTQSCTADLTTQWTLTASVITEPHGPDAIRLVQVAPGSADITLANTTVTVASCGLASILSLLSSFFEGTFEQMAQAAAGDVIADATVQIDALLSTTPVYVCD